MKFPFNLILIFAGIGCHAQNLVPNPSFELQDSCPPSAVGLFGIQNWYSMQWTPDQMCECSNSESNDVPSNAWGSQLAYDGSCYAAFVTYNLGWSDREYLAVELSSPLTIGEEYFISLMLSDADGGEIDELDCSSNNIGLLFMVDPPWWDYNQHNENFFEPGNFSHINYSAVLSDSLGWVFFQDSIVVDLAYTHLVIGNFFENDQTLIEQYGFGCTAIYYVDNVCVSTYSSDCLDGIFVPTQISNELELTFNPQNNTLVADGQLSHEVKLWQVMDTSGRIVFQEINSLKVQQVPPLPSGLYVSSMLVKSKIFTTLIIILK